jgi:hypothetical protein
MLRAVLTKEYAGPSLKPDVAEHFVQAVGSEHVSAIIVKAGGRLVIVPKPYDANEAVAIGHR